MIEALPEKLTPYQKELARLLTLSPITPGQYRPTKEVMEGEHAAVFVGDKPVLLCGPSDDKESIDIAWSLSKNKYFSHLCHVAGHEGKLCSGVASGKMIGWRPLETALVESVSGIAEVGDEEGALLTIVLGIRSYEMAVAMSINTEIVRAFNPSARELDDGFELARLAGEERKAINNRHGMIPPDELSDASFEMN